MALAKFGDWIVNEMGEPLPSAASEEPEEKEVNNQQYGQFKTKLNALLAQIDTVKTINKTVARVMLNDIIGALSERVKGLTGGENLALDRLKYQLGRNVK
jgi:hypothetical protein